MSNNWLQQLYQQTPGVFTIYVPADLYEFTEQTLKFTRDFSQLYPDKTCLVKRQSFDLTCMGDIDLDVLMNAFVYVVNAVMMEVRNVMNYQGDVILLITPERQHWNMCFWCRAYEVT